jgi:phage shock protein C
MSGEVKKLYRSRKARMLAGICGGLGEYFNVDPTMMRLIYVLATIFLPFMILVYLVMWVIVPEEPEAASDVVDTVAKEE